MSNVIQFPVITRKAADRVENPRHAYAPWQAYECIDCHVIACALIQNRAVYCCCAAGAEMRPIGEPGHYVDVCLAARLYELKMEVK